MSREIPGWKDLIYCLILSYIITQLKKIMSYSVQLQI